MRRFQFLAGLLAFTALAAAVAGCNTMRGVGKDLQHAGQKIQQTAR